jgi:hypothetical protein
MPIYFRCFFTVYYFFNLDFQLDYCSVNNKKHFHKEITLLTSFSWLLDNFFLFLFVCAVFLAEITPYFVINMTKVSQFWWPKKISNRLGALKEPFGSYQSVKVRWWCSEIAAHSSHAWKRSSPLTAAMVITTQATVL